MDYITINVNKKFLTVLVIVVTTLSASYYWGKYKYSKGVEDAIEYVMKSLSQDSGVMPNKYKKGL